MIKGSGLGGTSLINANVAILPDQEVFEQLNWPGAITYDALLPYYQHARQVLAANPHPRRDAIGQGAGARTAGQGAGYFTCRR